MSPELLSALIGAFMPYVVEAVKAFLPEKRWVGHTLSLLVSVLIAGTTSYISGEFNSENILASVGTALIASQSVYNLWFKPQKQDEAIAKAIRGEK